MSGADPSQFSKKGNVPDENARLLRELVELRAERVDSAADSACNYDELHAAGHLRQRDSFYRWLLSLLRPRPGQTLLEVSCGQGMLVHFSAQAGLRVAGFDLSSSAVAMAAKRAPSALVSQADAERLPYPDNTFDYVTNIGSLEHYFRPHWASLEMARVLRPEGQALILLPNTFGLLGNILHVWRTGDVHDDGQPLQRYGTYAQWRRLLEGNGLHVSRVVKYEREWPRTREDILWYALRPHKLGRVLLTPVIPLNLTSFLIYLCQKAPL
jgi:2-polyprenyl-3-methyl-5-hydroxy-6-metoxy-1,4-benzoquinol methylase